MASRKDLLKAQSFTTGRLVGAFVDRDPEQSNSSLRRIRTSTFVGILIAVILVAGTALFGFIKPGNSNAWREKAGLVQDINSGALFFYVPDPGGGEGVLVPMADIASARLAAGTTTVTTVKTAKLKGIPQDPLMRGIPGAPRQLPPSSEIKPYPLRLCATEANQDGQRYLTLEVGQGTNHTVTDDSSVVIRAADGDSYLLVDGIYHRLWRRGSASVIEQSVPVLTSAEGRRGLDFWLSAQPLGEPIEPFNIENFGGKPTARQAQPDLLIGHVAMVEEAPGRDAQYFIQTTDGLARTTYLNMETELAANEHQSKAVVLDPSVAASNMSQQTPELRTPGVRFSKPTAPANAAVGPEDSLCATWVDPKTSNGRTTPIITMGDPTPDLPTPVAKRPPSNGYVDHVKLAPLQGAILENMSGAPGAEGKAASWLILGDRRYGIPTAKDREALGYPVEGKGAPTVVQVPGTLIQLIPEGLADGHQLTRSSIVPPLPEAPK